MKKILSIIIILFFTSNCGFKIANKANEANFKIINISSLGEKRINYKIKNKLLFYSNENQTNLINLTLETVKQKNIKEKNIKNKVTKYEILIEVKVELIETLTLKKSEFSVKNSGDYSVANQHSQTLSNERKLLNLLSEELANDIFDKVRKLINAL